MTTDFKKYIRTGIPPMPFCPGCGYRILMRQILTAIDELQLNMDDMLFVSGIGCAAWIPSPHFNADTLHTLHGRAIAFATGAKMFNPKLNIMVISGDGDIADIGGNHLIHAARRNIDLTVVCANNMCYGMTGGQVCSTTPVNAITKTTPAGNSYPPFDMPKLVKAAGAQYVARYAVTQSIEVVSSIKKALRTSGFSFVEVLSNCPIQFGRINRMDTAKDTLEFITNICMTKEEMAKLSPGELKGKIMTGEFSNGGN
jgi:2-oxoglutarate ferredoxin oxidoreductase subunit beta